MQARTISLFGNGYSFSELKDALGDITAISGLKPYTLFDGPERGVFAIDGWTGSGLRYTVVPDRGMNICNTEYRTIPLDWDGSSIAVSYPPEALSEEGLRNRD